jgi:hypothetical protein
MLRRIGLAFGVLLAAIVLAVLSAWALVLHGSGQELIAVGPWRAGTYTGSAQAGLYVRANVAITGLFALNPSEAIYFSAAQDDAGQKLVAHCVYAIEGKPVAARWWSITAYADDNFLIPNPANRFSFNMGNLGRDDSGTFHVIAGPAEQPGNWLPTGTGDGGFSLLFRLYNPAPEVVANLRGIALPSIKPVGACP